MMARSWASIAAPQPKGPPPPVTPPPLSKNEYFTFTKDGHRESTQIWNVDGLIIYVQGNCPVFGENTYFAKKHLLTFQGGKASKIKGDIDGAKFDHGTIEGKSKEIFGKRTNFAKSAKYGNQLIDSVAGKNSYIICDLMTDSELKKIFADGLKNPVSKAHAKLQFATTAVWTLGGNGSWTTADHCKIQFRRSGSTYLIQHFSA